MKQQLKNLTICVLGYNTILGKLFIKKLNSHFDIHPDQLIYFIDFNNKSNSTKKQKFINDIYFDNSDKEFIKDHIVFSPLNQLSQNVNNQIHILFNFFVPLDLNQFDKSIQYHILNTNQICTVLKDIKIKKCLMVSSVYCQQPGYVAQTQKSENLYVVSVPKNLSKYNINNFVKESFSSNRQCWQWSIKNMEKQMEKITQSIQIIRTPSLGPTIDNYEGYSDKFNNFTYFMHLMGTGFFTTINGKPQNITDLIPADYLLNYMLVLSTKSQCLKLRIHNLSTSSRNPISIQKFFSYFVQSWQEYQKVSSKKPKIINKKWQKSLNILKQQLPIQVKSRISTILDFKKWKIQSQQQTLSLHKKNMIVQRYEYFLQNQWICQSNYSIDLFNELETLEKGQFPFNVNNINWKVYAKLCCYSIKKHLLHQNIERFQSSSTDLLLMQHGRSGFSYFSDILWALTEGKVVNCINHVQIKNYILTTKSVKQAIKSLVQQRMLKLQNDPISYEKAQQQLYKAADQMCTQMFSQYNMKSIRVFAWFLHKIFKTIYQKVVVDTNALTKIRNHNQKQNGPLIIIPTHRSYVDFLIMGYVFFGFGIKLPHIAAAQDFLNMALVHILLRQSGAFFIKRNQQKNKALYKAVMDEYITKILQDSHYLQFFIEGTRCRVGKMLPPKFGILSIVAKNVLEGKIVDATVLPVTVNYEKVLQGQSFTYQMMGQSKVKQSLSRLIKAVDTLKENYGRIYLQFCQPISVKKFFQHNQEQLGLKYPQALQKLGYQIVHSLSDKLLITAPSVLATVVLMHRKGISDDALSEGIMWLCKQITSRGIKIARSQSDSSISISNTMALLSDIVSKSKKNMFQVQVSLEQQSFIKLFLMTFYRNNLTHIFWQQSLIMLALISFGHKKITTKGLVSINELLQSTKFIYQLLIREYVLRYSLNDRNHFLKLLQFMQSKKIIEIQSQFVHLGSEGLPNGNYFTFYGSLSWPIIQSYWITCLYLFKLKNQKPLALQKFLTQIQWFAQSLINQRIVSHHESISIDTIKNAVDTFIQMKIIKKFNHQYKDGSKVNSVILNVDQTTLKKLQEKLESYLKKSYAKSVKGILQSGSSGSVNLDFPFLSKL